LRTGDRTVLWTEPVQGFANLLYLWLVAASRRARGEDVVVRHSAVMDAWLPVLPRLGELTVGVSDVRFRDRRDLGYHQAFGVDFSAEDLEAFVRGYLLGSPLLEDLEPGDGTRLTVNVRRGDYYSSTRFRGMYSFDIAEYLRAAVAGSIAADGPLASLCVVSDDPEWCRIKLGFLAEHAEQIDYLETGPREHFRTLASARRLVLANSTFSYWGAYVSNVVHADNHAQVWAPWFHRRDIHGGRAWHLDPRWSVVQDIPGGWDG
jgi:hypothetical protein